MTETVLQLMNPDWLRGAMPCCRCVMHVIRHVLQKEKLTTADTIHKKVEKIVKEAEEIISGLERDNLIISPINKKVNIQSLGHAMILENQELYSNKSRIERLFFKLTYSAKITWKGAYHTNPNYTHLYGWAELQNDLSAIKEASRKLREEAEIRRKMEIRLR